MRLRKLTLFLVLVLAVLVPSLAGADGPPTTLDQFNARLDRTRATLDEVHKSLDDPDLSDRLLRQLRDRIDPLRRDLEETIDLLTPRLAAVEARLKELQPDDKKPAEQAAPPPAAPAPAATAPAAPAAPKVAPMPPVRPAATKPDPKTAPAKPQAPPATPAAAEPAPGSAEASASAELVEQRKTFDAIDATLKRARAMLLETRQLGVSIVARQRALFARTLFLRTDGLFSPDLWRAALADAPGVYQASATYLVDRAEVFSTRMQSRRTEFLFALFVILLALPPAVILTRRVLTRNHEGTTPTRTRRAAAAGWTAIALAAVPVAAAMALGAVMQGLDLFDSSLEPIWRGVVDVIARVAFAYGVARAVFAPAHPAWRVIDPGDRMARLLVRLVTAGAIALSLTRFAEQMEEIVQASLPVVIVTRGLGVMAVAALIAIALLSLSARKVAAEGDVVATPEGRDWLMVTRALGVVALVLIVGACAFGYVSFASFVILQGAWMAVVAFALYVVVVLTNGAVAEIFTHDGLMARMLVHGLGVKRDQLPPISVLVSGLLVILAWIVAALVALSPLGYESHDIAANIRSAFNSFKIGDVTLSPSATASAIAIFFIVLAAVQGLRRWLDTKFLPLTRLDVGLRSSINATLGYAGVIAAAMTAMSSVGIGFEKLAIVAGALSVGIGFGLQSVVGNFVSGLILLWERAIRVGDWVVIGDEQGYVKRINVRSTEIETFDRATMIVPNQNLVSGVVKNWLRGDRVGRIKIAVAPHSGVDPEKMRDILLAAARAQEDVLRIPAPQVMFLGMEASGYKFELWCYVADVEKSARIRSDLHFDLHRRLAEAGIKLAATTEPPKTILQLPELDKLAAAAAASALAIEGGVVNLVSEKPDETREILAMDPERAET
jgi:potassium-dependent mechanosensitive channel